MRKTLLLILVTLAFGTSVRAQGFIPVSEQNKRKQELQALASRLLTSKDTHERWTIRKDMIEKDVIRDKDLNPGGGDKVLGDGFSVDAFVWLYREGVKNKDLNARLDAVIGLASLASAAARDPLIEALNDPNEAIQLRVIQAIDKASVVRAGKLVIEKLSSPNSEVVAASAKCLADLNVQGGVGTMIALMAQTYGKLVKEPLSDPARTDDERLIEVLGRACGQLVQGVTWTPGTSIEDLGKEIDKFTQWWNQNHVGALKDPHPDVRKEALSSISLTADKNVFPPVLEAVSSELTKLRSSDSFEVKKQAQQFIVDASAILSRISGKNTTLRATSSTQEIQAAVKEWQAWWDLQPK
jgi:hypothetical protein